MGQRITIEIKDKIATCLTALPVVCGNSDYVVDFLFDEEWNAHDMKTARFKVNGEYTDVVFSGNTCEMPIIFNAMTIWVGVFAGELSTTTPAMVHCRVSILDGDDTPSQSQTEGYNKLIEMCEDALEKIEGLHVSNGEGEYSIVQEGGNEATAYSTAAFGAGCKAKDGYAFAIGRGSEALAPASYAEGYYSKATKNIAHAEGSETTASGQASHSEGSGTEASADSSHAEGRLTKSSGNYSHSEGWTTQATAESDHAEGGQTTASGGRSHAEGTLTKATAWAAHAEGMMSEASGLGAHAEGRSTVASHNYSHAGGFSTRTSRVSQHVGGEYNADEWSAFHIVGCGTGDNDRANCFTTGVYGGEKYIKVGGEMLTEAQLNKLQTIRDALTIKFYVNDTLFYMQETEYETVRGTTWREFAAKNVAFDVVNQDGTSYIQYVAAVVSSIEGGVKADDFIIPNKRYYVG